MGFCMVSFKFFVERLVGRSRSVFWVRICCIILLCDGECKETYIGFQKLHRIFGTAINTCARAHAFGFHKPIFFELSQYNQSDGRIAMMEGVSLACARLHALERMGREAKKWVALACSSRKVREAVRFWCL